MTPQEVGILLGMIGFVFGVAAGVILQSWRIAIRTAPGSAKQDRPFGRTVTLEAAEPLSKGQMVYLDSTGRAVGDRRF